MGVMTYKGYDGLIRYSEEDHIFYGVVQGISDKILFEGTSVDELEEDFHASVDDYLEFCKKIGKIPDKVYRGSFNVRISPELHKKACFLAGRRDISLNQFVEEAIRNQVIASDVKENYKQTQSMAGWLRDGGNNYEDYNPDMLGDNIVLFKKENEDKTKKIKSM